MEFSAISTIFTALLIGGAVGFPSGVLLGGMIFSASRRGAKH